MCCDKSCCVISGNLTAIAVVITIIDFFMNVSDIFSKPGEHVATIVIIIFEILQIIVSSCALEDINNSKLANDMKQCCCKNVQSFCLCGLFMIVSGIIGLILTALDGADKKKTNNTIPPEIILDFVIAGVSISGGILALCVMACCQKDNGYKKLNAHIA